MRMHWIFALGMGLAQLRRYTSQALVGVAFCIFAGCDVRTPLNYDEGSHEWIAGEACAPGLLLCNGLCRDFDFDSDPRHCGCGDGVIDVSNPFDGFETGDISQLPWSTMTVPGYFSREVSTWATTTAASDVHEGSYGLVSQNAGVDQSSARIKVSLTTIADGEICFWYSGESENRYDQFRFGIDDTALLVVSGLLSWREVCYAVAAGIHTFEWNYDKDSNGNTGVDRFAIDDIRFPPIAEQCDNGEYIPSDGCNSNCLSE